MDIPSLEKKKKEGGELVIGIIIIVLVLIAGAIYIVLERSPLYTTPVQEEGNS